MKMLFRRLLLLFATGSALMLAACGGTDYEEEFEVLAEDLFEAVTFWENKAMTNELKRVSGDTTTHHLIERYYFGYDGQIFISVHDLLLDDRMVSYMYIEGDTAYIFEDHTSQGGSKEYRQASRDEMRGNYPTIEQMLTQNLNAFPSEDMADDVVSFKEYYVRYDRDSGEFEAFADMFVDDDGLTFDVSWRYTGDLEKFTIELPELETGMTQVVTYQETDFFETWDGIDTSLHE